MKIVVIRDNLKNAVSAAQKAEGTNPNLPILRNCLFAADAQGIQVTTTNLDLAISCSLTGRVIEAGKFTAPIRLLGDILGVITTERLNIEKKEAALVIQTDNYEAQLQGISADDFPLIPKMEKGKQYLEMPADVFISAAEQVLASAHASELRPELNNILLRFSVDALRLAATDSFRLSEKTIFQNQFTTTHTNEFSLLIPLKTTTTLASVIPRGDVLRVYHDDTQVLFVAGHIELLSRISEGTFPDYVAILPKRFSAEIVVNKEELMSAVRAAGVFGGKNNEAKFRAHENKKLLEVLSSEQGLGENKYLLPARIKGKAGEVVFNWKYIVDALKAIQGEEVSLGINGDGEPSQIRSLNDPSYFYIVKPIAGG